MTGVPRFRRYVATLAFVAAALTAPHAGAAGVRSEGSAKVSEWKKPPGSSAVRARALRRARLAALTSALEQLDGPLDAEARRAVLREGTRWTGAYRILRERMEPEGVVIELEVDVDVARLAKFVAPARAPAPSKVRFHVAEISAARGCDVEATQLDDDLSALGVARAKAGTSESVRVTLSCEALGPVPNTLLQAVRIRAQMMAGERMLVDLDAPAFGVDEQSARERGAGAVAEAVAAAIVAEPDGVLVRVERPHPASRVRRLQRAIADQVAGVRQAHIVGIEPDGSLQLRLEGRASAADVASRLRALSLPDFSITIVGVNDSRGLTIRLR